MPVPPCRKARVPSQPSTTLTTTLGEYFSKDPAPSIRLLKSVPGPRSGHFKTRNKGPGPQKEYIYKSYCTFTCWKSVLLSILFGTLCFPSEEQTPRTHPSSPSGNRKSSRERLDVCYLCLCVNLTPPKPTQCTEWSSDEVQTIDHVIQRKGRVRDSEGRRKIELRSAEWDVHSMYGQTKKFSGEKLPTFSHGIFPGTAGWGSDRDASGRTIDYSSCQYGGPFGKRPVRDTYVPTAVPPDLQKRGSKLA